MDKRISATDLARRLGDVLGRVRYRGDTFLVERNGVPVARISPAGAGAATLGEALLAWRTAAPTDPSFAEALERVRKADREPRDPWE
jgi:prevent-host-death family protein